MGPALRLVAALGLVAALTVGCRHRLPPRPVSAPPATAAPDSPFLAPLPTPSTAPTTVPLPPPPYQVLTTTLPFVDPSRPTVSHGQRISTSRAVTTVVWAPAIGTHWPLVILAPGYKVGPDTYAQLGRAWAAQGYVVAAPEFPLADPAVAGAALDESDLDNEPADVNFVIGSLVAPSSPMASRVDPLRIAVTGHSDGAEAALAVAQQGDSRIKAVIAMAGQPVLPHQAPNPPLLAIQGDQDTINPPGRSLAVYQQATRPRFLLTLLGAPHLAPFAGGSKWQPVVDAVTVDFLNHYLAGATGDDARMQAEAAQPGLSTLR